MGRLNFIILMLLLSGGLYAQQEVCLTLANELADANAGTYTFDLYLSAKENNQGRVYLATSDFRLEFDTQVFNQPQLEIVTNPNPDFGIQGGYCSFVSANPDSGVNDALVRRNYHNLLATSISGNLATINLNSPSASATTIGSGIAVIDEQRSAHRLGRFRFTGYQGGNPAFQLKLAGVLRTRVFTFDSVAPFNANELPATLCTTTDLESVVTASIPVRCYPNPAGESCWFEVEGLRSQTVELEILDQQGRRVRLLSWQVRPGVAHRVPLRGLAAGIYAYRLKADSRTASGKLFIR